jgi:hypothetical protein
VAANTARGIQRADDPDRGVEPLERFFLNDRRQRLADAARARVFVHDEHAAAVPGDGQHALAIERRERAQIEHARSMPLGGSASATRMRACTYAPYEMIARSSPARRSAALPTGTVRARSRSVCLIADRDRARCARSTGPDPDRRRRGHQRARIDGVDGTTIFSPGVR